ncbi:hypothetical protein KQ693_05885 [Thermus sp. PS18]|uniref:hypothetical protein n=1 Tax=Thermus sp. PS18 TaxID=2849039 RepID=UPI002264657F|nr:hypothetical protein [Thermus sp. PS18]UZX16559.1 hypothetical protein KQ693_05885 [Thermus sp. PS18]
MPTINGYIPDWGSIEVSVAGKKYEAKEINYSIKAERTAVYGSQGKKLGYTRGHVDYEADVTLYIEDAVDLLNTLGNGYMEKTLDITVSYTLGNGRVVTDRLIGCRIKEVSDGHSQGNEPLTRKFSLDVAEVKLAEKKAR